MTGLTLILIALVGLLGADWDIQWHAVIGRDRTFTPPHDLILIGIGLPGIMALINILIETNWSGRRPELRAYSTDFLGVLRSSLGSYLIGFGAVCSAVAFPLDTYWHALYGIDVSLWAPFHTMIYMGSVLSTFGVIFLLLLLLVSTFVPPMMTLLVQAEHETYLARASHIGSSIIPLSGQTPVLLLTALSLDSVVWLGRRGQWVLTRQNTWGLVAAMVSMVLVAEFTLVQIGVRTRAARGGSVGRSLVLELVLSLLLTVPGSLLGNWLALTISKTVQALRR